MGIESCSFVNFNTHGNKNIQAWIKIAQCIDKINKTQILN